MTMYLVRDDDANATTEPERLERVYAPLLDAGIPVSFAVIPEVALDTRAPDGARERFLDSSRPDSSTSLPLRWDTPLARWIRANQGQVSVMMHGLSHSRRRSGTEFGALTGCEAADLVARGIDIMVDSLGRCPRAFVAPWDALSKGSLSAATSAFDLVSTGFVDRDRLSPADWAAHAAERVSGSQALPVGHGWVLRHKGCRITGATRASEVGSILDEISANAEICVVVLHHWMFREGPSPHEAVRELARVLHARTVCGVEGAIRHLDSLPPGWALARAAQHVRNRLEAWAGTSSFVPPPEDGTAWSDDKELAAESSYLPGETESSLTDVA